MEIHWIGSSEVGDYERERAESRIGRLAEGHDDLIDVRIAVHTTAHHQHGGAEVKISCQARGRELVAGRERPELRLALNESLEAFEREVRRLRSKRRERSRVRAPEPHSLGVVDKIFRDEGYGFILTDDGEQVYFHRNAVQEGLDFDRMEEADRVELTVEGGAKGPQAASVIAPPRGQA